MSLNNITFNLGQGGLGRPLPGEDYISGLLFYTNGSLPSGFSSSARVKQILSVADAEALGITNTYSDETKATATYLVTTAGADGNTVELKVAAPFSQVVSLGVYTKVTADSTVANVATAIAAVINAETNTHGYTATVNSATVTISAKAGLGIFLNTGTPLTATYSAGATLAGTITQFSGGVASKYAVWYYHISEYFRLQPQGNLYVGIYAVPGSYTFTEITTMQTYADGKIRQIGVFKDSAAFASADITAIHNVCAANVAAHKEIVALYGADLSGMSDISTIADLSSLTANYCSAVISQDGGALGATLFYATGKSVTTLGATLGAVAKAKVSHSIAWVAQFNISNGTECDVLAFANGVLFTHSSVTDSLLSALQNKRYIFLRKFVGVAGSYFNENSTSISTTSDYAYITDNRTIQKATRGIYSSVLPALNSPITLKSNGTLSDEAAAYFQGLAESPLNDMVRNGELSGFSVNVNVSQNVLSTGVLVINVTLVQVATGRNIVINIGYNVTI
jgi:spore maturation protein SpmB